MSARNLIALAAGTLLGILAFSVAAPGPARAASYSSPEWWPLRGSNEVGCARNSTGPICGGNYHSWWGIDVEGPAGQNVYAAGSGVARVYSSESGCSGYGKAVVIDHGEYGKSLYGHLSSIKITDGQQVTRNTVIGAVGGTGFTIPCGYVHLHYEETSTGGSFGPSGSSRDPGALKACHGGQLVSYPSAWGRSSWNGLPGQTYSARSDGTGCAGNNPQGSYDLASSPDPGAVRIGGWAFDLDAKTTPVNIHAYVGGTAGSGAEGHSLGAANRRRVDVGKAYPGTGNNHGFDFTFSTGRTGSQSVCVYAINKGPGSNKLLGCKTVNVSDPRPLGAFDSLTSPEAGIIRVRGWTFDPNQQTKPNEFHVYVGGEAGKPGVEGHDLGPAARVRADVGRVYPGAGSNHGFDSSFETRKTGEQKVCVYGINLGRGSNRLLGCKTTKIVDPSPQGSLDSVVSPRPGRIDVKGWTFDRSDVTRALNFHVYVGGEAGGAGVEQHGVELGLANALRSDVERVYPGVGEYHGLARRFPTRKTGLQEVCVYGINVGPGSDRLLGCKTVEIEVDRTAPTTEIVKAPRRRVSTKKRRNTARFTFASSEQPASFQCSLDGATWTSCPRRTSVSVSSGRRGRRHTLAVRAIDFVGNVDATPTRHRWKVTRR